MKWWLLLPTNFWVIWLLLSGLYTYSAYVYATVTRTHGHKNARDALMHACPSTRRNTHGHAQVLNLHVHAHTHTQSGWASDRINTRKYIYIYIERNERIMKSTDHIFTNIQWQTVYYLVWNLAILTVEEVVWTSITLLCPVNLPNEEKLAGREKLPHGGS